jgi:hypothetical protein
MTEQYLAYLLRLWLKKQNNEWAWRIYLENIHTGEQHNFASMDNLVAFLKEIKETGQQAKQTDQSDQ